MKKNLLKLAGFGLMLALVVGGFAYWYGFLRQEKPIEKMKPDFEITADSLYSAFGADETAATAKYGGKILLVSSDLVAVDKDERGNVTIILVDPMMGVTCTIDSLQAIRQKADIDGLAEGSPVRVKGRCDGMLTDVKISNCMIIK